MGVMLKGNQVLLQQPETYDFWTLPGGGVHFHETLQDAVVREWYEETGFEIEVKRLPISSRASSSTKEMMNSHL